MGCLFQLFFFVIAIVLLPILFLLNSFGRAKRRTFTFRSHDNASQRREQEYQPDDSDDTPRNNTPIDQSTVEYIDFEEVEDTQSKQ